MPTAVRCLTLLLIVTAVTRSGAQTWDLASDFSTASNPAGAWSFGESPPMAMLDPPGGFTAFPFVGPYTSTGGVLFPDIQHWYGAAGLSLPGVFKNVGPGALLIQIGLSIPAGAVFIHPGSTNQHAMVRWTAPEDGTYDVFLRGTLIDGQAKTVDAHLLRDGVEIAEELIGDTGEQATLLDGPLTLLAGETLTFSVGYGVDGYGNDSTLVDFTVTRVAGTWADLGGAASGGTWSPTLAGAGDLLPGSATTLDLAGAPPAQPCLLWLSLTSTPLPFSGGVLYALPPTLELILPTDPAGALQLVAPWPAGVPGGTSVWFQVLVRDLAQPSGIGQSNALEAVTP